MSTLNVTTIQHESASGNNIVLDSDGNVEIAGSSEFGWSNNTSEGVKIDSGGVVNVRRDTSTSDALAVYSGGAASADTKKFVVAAEGSASFAGGLTTIDKWGQLKVNTPSATGYAFQCKIEDGDSTVIIEGNGNITSEGQVEAKGGIKFGDGTTQTTAGVGAAAWGYVNSSGISNATYNCSVERETNGSYKITFTDELDDWKYAVIASCGSTTYDASTYIDSDTGAQFFMIYTQDREANTIHDSPFSFVVYNAGGTSTTRSEAFEVLRARLTQQDAVIAQMVTALRSQGVTIDTTEVKE